MQNVQGRAFWLLKKQKVGGGKKSESTSVTKLVQNVLFEC